MRRLRTRLGALALGLLGLLGVVALTALPASASPNKCVFISDHGVNYLPTEYEFFWGSSGTVYSKKGCFNIAVKGTGVPNEYYFQVEAQDMLEQPWASSQGDDLGVTQIQYRTPGSSVWHDWTSDQNSADWNVAWGTSATYNIIIHGRPEQWVWRVKSTAHYAPCCNFTWIWGVPQYTPSQITVW